MCPSSTLLQSGVTVHGEVLTCFQKMKMHTTKNAVDRQKAVMFEIQENEVRINRKNCINVDDIGTAVQDAHKSLTDILRQQPCCYILYDVEYETSVTKKQDLGIVHSPVQALAIPGCSQIIIYCCRPGVG
uniref:ADF-H domain-containing protein n=1 Tax=Eptatretus burgeri TaxID=7764 RepID=A0A8C4N9Z5_EPTBU